MQLWLILAILSSFSFSISTSIDKYFMNKNFEPVTTNTFKMFFDGLILLIIGYFFFELSFSANLILWSALLGTLYAFAGILYFTVLKLKDVQIVIPFTHSSKMVLTFIASLILFNEAANLLNYLGVALILIGIYSIMSNDGFKLPKVDRGITLILFMIIIGTVYSLLVKRLLYGFEPINLAIVMYFSSAIILTGYVLITKKNVKAVNLKSSKIFIAAIFGALGTLLLYYALSVGNASKVYPIAGAQSVFIFIIALIFLKERFRWKRLIGTAIVVAGIYLVSL